ncbi:MAG TPA: hypothetical protein VM142_00915 [Acidimicrobiales bacterium]|nr:hypothetical protein [Acidimicrobiales bacterium]
MPIILRESFELSDDDEVVIHMGAGVHADVVCAALRNYHDYAGLAGRPGAFTMSVFAAIGGVSKDDILRALPHHRFGVATYAALRDLELWPTTITGTAIPERIMAVHFDIVLDDGAVTVPAGRRIPDLTDTELSELERLLRPAVAAVLPLFQPREEK